ncbi:D-TA family PLP-dependent enzyme [Pedobacter sp. PLR]|uniref:D-TA family PLP-dependent enzyme n=1 Tax=Pedobacter sp. PLR TaxID=2994465 RepID=UPI002245AA1D|nr:D-TA family PLP-dependent enzyme [Pedobacter sp. PLR]MCX2450982.1 D-TA family PLP-dependent enzyme [Pedobacter sp. PLR]
MENWQEISNLDQYDTPLFVVYEDRVKQNIEMAIALLSGDISRFRPHIKTHKMGEVLQLFSGYGIHKIKCATIAEAELAALNGMTDVMIAYQPVGFKIHRMMALIAAFPDCKFSCLVDNLETAREIAAVAQGKGNAAGTEIEVEPGQEISVYLDLNTGMNRTGFPITENVVAFVTALNEIHGLKFMGLHIYDGHIHDPDPAVRAARAKPAMDKVLADADELFKKGFADLKIVAGGSNTFSYYSGIERLECSPGTFVFWDENYTRLIPELNFKHAAVLVCSVISLPAPGILCVDLGYKSVSSENPIEKRVVFPWNEDLTPIGHSEEHLTLKHIGPKEYKVGDRIYGLPYHVCPSCALYEEAQVVNDHQIEKSWRIRARDKKISI